MANPRARVPDEHICYWASLVDSGGVAISRHSASSMAAELWTARAVIAAARALSRFRAGVETWTTDDVALEGELLTALDGALAVYDAEVPRG